MPRSSQTAIIGKIERARTPFTNPYTIATDGTIVGTSSITVTAPEPALLRFRQLTGRAPACQVARDEQADVY